MIVVVSDVEQFETILNHPDCLDKGNSYRYIAKVLGDGGLITLRSAKWKVHRKLLNPSFQYKIVNSFESIFNGHAKELVVQLEKMVDCEEFDILAMIKTCAIDTICGNFFLFRSWTFKIYWFKLNCSPVNQKDTTMDTKSGENSEYTAAINTYVYNYFLLVYRIRIFLI